MVDITILFFIMTNLEIGRDLMILKSSKYLSKRVWNSQEGNKIALRRILSFLCKERLESFELQTKHEHEIECSCKSRYLKNVQKETE